MNLEEIRKLALKTMGKRQSHVSREKGYVYFHGQRVARIALTLRTLIYPERTEEDQAILVGGWFHDVGKGIEPHWEYGAVLTKKILEEYCAEPQLAKIVEVVGGHTLRKQKDYPYYVQLVQDADILDHFGSQDVWLSFLYAAANDGNIESTLAYWETEYPKEREKVVAALNFPQSIEFFLEKDRFLGEFVERFRLESTGELWGIRKN